MSICKAIFGKGIYELELPDIISFFEVEQEESSILEFKSGATELEAIHKEVSAFLNTEGGILIVGAPKEKRKEGSKSEKVCVGLPDPCKSIASQDTLIKSIATNISPSPVGVKIANFNYSEGKIFVIEIPQSFTPPHQCNNEGKYYIRLERDAKAAPHGIVEALFLKRQRPDLQVDLEVASNENDENISLDFSLTNDSIITAENFGFNIRIHGIEELISHENLNCEVKFEEDLMSAQRFSSSILVKGMNIPIRLHFKPLYPFFLVEFSYYCKDMQLERFLGIYEINNDFSFKEFNSKEINSDYSITDIHEYFNLLKKEYYKTNFKASEESKNLPAEIEQILAVEKKLNTKFPNSYFYFLTTCNGCFGSIGENNITLFPINEIIERTERIRARFMHYKPVVIGIISDDDPIIIFWDDDKKCYSFGFIRTIFSNGSYLQDVIFLGKSLIEALKKSENIFDM